MKWFDSLLEEIERGIDALKRKETWIVIGIIALFGLLLVLITRFAFRTDNILIYAHRTAAACREMTNATIIGLFCGMIFFFFSSVLTLGELQRYFYFKRINAYREAESAMRGLLVHFCITLALAGAGLAFFSFYCR